MFHVKPDVLNYYVEAVDNVFQLFYAGKTFPFLPNFGIVDKIFRFSGNFSARTPVY